MLGRSSKIQWWSVWLCPLTYQQIRKLTLNWAAVFLLFSPRPQPIGWFSICFSVNFPPHLILTGNDITHILRGVFRWFSSWSKGWWTLNITQHIHTNVYFFTIPILHTHTSPKIFMEDLFSKSSHIAKLDVYMTCTKWHSICIETTYIFPCA